MKQLRNSLDRIGYAIGGKIRNSTHNSTRNSTPRLLLWLHALLIAALLLSPAGAVLAQDDSGETPAPVLDVASPDVTPDVTSPDMMPDFTSLDVTPDVTSPDVTPGAVELVGPPPQPLQPVDEATVNGPTEQLYLPLVAQGEMQASAAQAAKSLDMKLLLIAADGKETDYPAIRATLDQLGIPYDVLLSATQPLTASLLSNGDRGYYQGIILATGNLGFYNSTTQQWESGFDWAEWNILWQYEAAFGVRQVTSYTYPGGWPDSYGLNLVTARDTTAEPVSAQFTTAGRQVYADLNTNNPVAFKNTWVYLATVVNTAVTTPLLTTSEGYAIASITTYPDGRQNLAITAANNPYLLHSLQLAYGTINWLTKGLYLGYRKVWVNPQIDDLLIDSDMWDIAAQSDTTGLLFRLSGDDLAKAVAWQTNVRRSFPLASSLTLEWAYNGEGASGIYSPDTLTPAVRQNRSAFTFVNHTYSHANLDPITYTLALSELQRNHQTATSLGLTRYYRDAMVQPDISGLNNAEFHRAARAFGIKYLISDTSRPGWNNPSPNAGFYSTYQPSILIIPRRPTNLFYNLSTPAEWVSEYNCFYGPTGICAGGQFRYWDHDLTYAEILDRESDMLLQYLLKWDIDPLMFHQANVRAYDGANSLLGDLLQTTLRKYSQAYNLPVQFITQHDIGLRMAQRMTYNNARVTATLIPCQSITLRTVGAARISITGIAYGALSNREVYGGQTTSFVSLSANQSITLPVSACN